MKLINRPLRDTFGIGKLQKIFRKEQPKFKMQSKTGFSKRSGLARRERVFLPSLGDHW